MKSYYNEFSPFPAQWLRNLIRDGILEEGVVDERSIEFISGDEIAGFKQFHAFCGVGGWPIALQKAGWPEEVPVWTGSCPCQPFSTAGKQTGTADERHLWPEFLRLVKENRPPHIFGEQVSGRKVTGKLFAPRAWERLESEDRRAAEEADSEAWFHHVQTDLEKIGYIVGHCVFPAASVGSPHARQRLYWYAQYVGDSADSGQGRREAAAVQRDGSKRAGEQKRPEQAGELPWGSEGLGTAGRVADRDQDRRNQTGEGKSQTRGDGTERDGSACELDNDPRRRRGEERPDSGGVRERITEARDETGGSWAGCAVGELADTGSKRLEGRQKPPARNKCQTIKRSGDAGWPGPTNGYWQAADWIICRDTDSTGNHKWRPVESGSSPLAYGILSRASKISAGIQWLGLSAKTLKAVLRESKAILKAARSSRKGQLAGYGNAIVIPQAVEFIKAVIDEDWP